MKRLSTYMLVAILSLPIIGWGQADSNAENAPAGRIDAVLERTWRYYEPRGDTDVYWTVPLLLAARGRPWTPPCGRVEVVYAYPQAEGSLAEGAFVLRGTPVLSGAILSTLGVSPPHRLCVSLNLGYSLAREQYESAVAVWARHEAGVRNTLK